MTKGRKEGPGGEARKRGKEGDKGREDQKRKEEKVERINDEAKNKEQKGE